MNGFDVEIVQFFNQLAGWSPAFDAWVVLASRNSLIKGAVLAAAIWWAWFDRGDHRADCRSHVLATIIGSLFAMVLARGLAFSLPFRTRPLNETVLDFTLPYGMGIGYETWSSFPSDHAVLFVTLSVGLLFVSRRLGTLALIYSTVVVLLTYQLATLFDDARAIAKTAAKFLMCLLG